MGNTRPANTAGIMIEGQKQHIGNLKRPKKLQAHTRSARRRKGKRIAAYPQSLGFQSGKDWRETSLMMKMMVETLRYII